MASDYFYKRGDREFGPVDGEQLKGLARSGQLSPQDRVRRSNSTTWVVASSVGGLFAGKAGGDVPPPLPPGVVGVPRVPPSAEPSEASALSPAVAEPAGESGGARFGRLLLQWLKVAGREAFLVLRATGAQILRLFGFGRGAWQSKRLDHNLQQARIQLGRKLAETGVGDRELLARVRQLNDTIISVEAAKGSTKRYEQERIGLFIRLADSVKGSDVPSTVAGEYAAVVQANSALLSRQEQQGTARSHLLPPPGPDRWRVAAGAGAGVLALVLAILPMFSKGGSGPTPPSPVPSPKPVSVPGNLTSEEYVERARAADEPVADVLAEARKLLQQGKAHVKAGDEAQQDAEEFDEEYRAAVEDFSAAIELVPQLTEAFVERGHALIYLVDYPGAIRDLTVAIELDPELAEAWSWRALAFADTGENDQAISDADRAISLKYNLPWAHGTRGAAYMNKGDMDEAVASLTTAIDMAPYVLFLVNRSNCYLNLGNNQGAYDDATLAIEASPSYAVAYNNRGAALLNVLRYDEARSDFDSALSIEPGTALYLSNRAFANWGLGDARGALSDAEEAVAADSSSGRTYIIRAAAYELNDRLDEAMADLVQAEGLGAQDPMWYLIRGNVYFKQQQYQAALDDYDAAIAGSPNWPTLYEQRGNCHAAMGNQAQANQDFAYARQLLGR